MNWETVLYEKIDRVAMVTLNRPEKRNAQNTMMIRELDEALKEAERDAQVRVIVIAGAGSCFSSGHDLSVWNAQPGELDDGLDLATLRGTLEGQIQHEQEWYFDKCLYIRNLPKPTIAQVHGYCWAAGLQIAAMCDIIYASEDATFRNPVVRMACSTGEILFSPWEFGARFAKEFLFTGDIMSAQDAFRLGFVNKVVPAERLNEEVMGLAGRIAVTPPYAVKLTKASINHTLDLMGQAASWRQHFLVHQLSHVTDESRQFNESRGKAGSLKDQLQYQKGNFST